MVREKEFGKEMQRTSEEEKEEAGEKSADRNIVLQKERENWDDSEKERLR